MQIIKNKEKIGNILFIAAIVIELVIMMTDHMSSITLPLRGRWAQLAFVLFGCKILTTRYNLKQWMAIGIMGVIGTVSYFTMGDEFVLRAAVMVFAAKDINRELTYRIMLWGSHIGTAVIMLLAITGIAGVLYDVRDYGREGIEKRWCFGFNHANNIHCMFWYLVVMNVLVRNDKLKIYDYVVMLIADGFLYVLTGSKTGLIAVALVVVASAIDKLIKNVKNRKWPYILGGISVGACLIVTIIGSKYSCFESEFCAYLDRFLNQRLNMCHDYAYLGDWKIFPEARELGKAVDNGLASFAYLYGIVMLAIVIAAILYLIWKAYREKNFMLMVLAVTCTYVWFMESTFIINTSLLCMVILILLFDRWYISESI